MSQLQLLELDPWLAPFEGTINSRYQKYQEARENIITQSGSLEAFATAHNFYGLHLVDNHWVIREWAPNATTIYLVGNFSQWQSLPQFQFSSIGYGNWELRLDKSLLHHGDIYKLHLYWEGGDGERLPAYATRVVQDEKTHIFSAQVWQPEQPHQWSDTNWHPHNEPPLIYEAHIGMSSNEEKVSTYKEFRLEVLPRIIKGGYNTIQFMAIQEHPYYGSFGYHVANFFAVTSRFGDPEELKALVDEAHRHGINVIMDLVHSHAVKNEVEGLGRFDGTTYQYFYPGEKGFHPAWDSRCFDYGKMEVIRFLLSNVRYWLETYHFDGFRFDGVTSMLYLNHGLEVNFTSYSDYFRGEEDEEAISYLTLANELIHQIKPSAVSVAEEMSGYPGLCGRIEDGGMGFDYRLSMGVPDFWIKMVKDTPDEAWNMGMIYHELTQHRVE